MASLPEPDALTLAPPPAEGGHGSGRAGAGLANAPRAAPKAQAPAAPAARAPTGGGAVGPLSFDELPALLEGSVALKRAVERDMRPVRFEPGRIEVTLLPGAEPTVAGELGTKLTELTGRRWIVTVSEAGEGPTLRERYEAEQAALKTEAENEPLVRTILDTFSDARVDAVRVSGERDDSEGAPPAQRAAKDS